MVRMILSGCSGRMGRVITDMVKDDQAIEIVAGIDTYNDGTKTYPVFATFAECDVEADVIVDFSSPNVFANMMEYSAAKQVPAVVCTTGLSDEQLALLDETSKKVAVLRSANMSLGINILQKLVAEAAQKLADAGFDIEIEERHHNKKKDAPSGTAIALADSINEAMDHRFEYVYDRSQVVEARTPNQIGFASTRGGTIVGDHTVVFAGTDEVIEFSHHAYSRAIFAKGAVQAAKYLAGKPAGFYNMSNVIEG